MEVPTNRPADRLAAALHRWNCRVDGTELRGGMSVVVPVRSADGSPLMIKLLDPQAARKEAIALRAFPPSASVRCEDAADDLGALLLERLTADSLAGHTVDDQITVQADLARRLAVADPGGIDHLSDNDGWLEHLSSLLRQRPRLLDRRTIDLARRTITDLDQDRTVTLTHGDLHAINVHADATGAWRALDPNPRVGTIAYESHTIILERSRFDDLVRAGSVELLHRLALFSEVAGVDRSSSALLCQARAVSSALYEHLQGNRTLAAHLRWMADALTPA
ncbi:aminoglycoside phosphotransferase family protein [Microlunatus soli]|uniref:Streptomycin 6-kinase n=1 Tax=Microlunatus soli TaxID=630515 RepID=A0A1H1NZV4_9ACTN|nr:aminoglycoside phosphotransferase family protein [Microlunatus soli]SDS04487.1 streptomycin 6-kinase [Microlunatus soli]